MKTLPTGFTAHSGEGNLSCPHRNLSVCPTCADAHPQIVEIYGLHFWVAHPSHRTTLDKLMQEIER